MKVSLQIPATATHSSLPMWLVVYEPYNFHRLIYLQAHHKKCIRNQYDSQHGNLSWEWMEVDHYISKSAGNWYLVLYNLFLEIGKSPSLSLNAVAFSFKWFQNSPVCWGLLCLGRIWINSAWYIHTESGLKGQRNENAGIVCWKQSWSEKSAFNICVIFSCDAALLLSSAPVTRKISVHQNNHEASSAPKNRI